MLCEQLDRLHVDDQKRKQTLVRPTAQSSAQPVVAAGRQRWLERFFEDGFIPQGVLPVDIPATQSVLQSNESSASTSIRGERTSSPRRSLR
jgi:hypothetical protein